MQPSEDRSAERVARHERQRIATRRSEEEEMIGNTRVATGVVKAKAMRGESKRVAAARGAARFDEAKRSEAKRGDAGARGKGRGRGR